jgi:hypothetical protein
MTEIKFTTICASKSSTEQTSLQRTHITYIGYDGQHLAANDCECFENLSYKKGSLIVRNFKLKKILQSKNLHIVAL